MADSIFARDAEGRTIRPEKLPTYAMTIAGRDVISYFIHAPARSLRAHLLLRGDKGEGIPVAALDHQGPPPRGMEISEIVFAAMMAKASPALRLAMGAGAMGSTVPAFLPIVLTPDAPAKRPVRVSALALTMLWTLDRKPRPASEFMLSMANYLRRHGMVASATLPSPYETRPGALVHLQITDKGRSVLMRGISAMEGQAARRAAAAAAERAPAYA